MFLVIFKGVCLYLYVLLFSPITSSFFLTQKLVSSRNICWRLYLVESFWRSEGTDFNVISPSSGMLGIPQNPSVKHCFLVVTIHVLLNSSPTAIIFDKFLSSTWGQYSSRATLTLWRKKKLYISSDFQVRNCSRSRATQSNHNVKGSVCMCLWGVWSGICALVRSLCRALCCAAEPFTTCTIWYILKVRQLMCEGNFTCLC